MDVADNTSEQASAVAAEVAAELQPDLVSLGPFVLPQPPPLTEDEAAEVGRSAVGRVFGMVNAAETDPSPAKGKTQQQLGFARLAGSTFDRDAWAVLLSRLATRAPAGLEGGGKVDSKRPSISDSIRQTLYRYVLEDFRGRLNIAITWLSEEWYNDRVQMKAAATQRDQSDEEEDKEPTVPLHYDEWVVKLFHGFTTYLDARDIKVLVRFLSEIPEVTISVLQMVAGLAKDPERVNLCVQALMYVFLLPVDLRVYTNISPRYLIMFRPPAREMCLNTLEDVYQTCMLPFCLACSLQSMLIQSPDEESRPAAGKVLAKWRPQNQPAEANGTADSTPAPPQEAQVSAAQ